MWKKKTLHNACRIGILTAVHVYWRTAPNKSTTVCMLVHGVWVKTGKCNGRKIYLVKCVQNWLSTNEVRSFNACMEAIHKYLHPFLVLILHVQYVPEWHDALVGRAAASLLPGFLVQSWAQITVVFSMLSTDVSRQVNRLCYIAHGYECVCRISYSQCVLTSHSRDSSIGLRI